MVMPQRDDTIEAIKLRRHSLVPLVVTASYSLGDENLEATGKMPQKSAYDPSFIGKSKGWRASWDFHRESDGFCTFQPFYVSQIPRLSTADPPRIHRVSTALFKLKS